MRAKRQGEGGMEEGRSARTLTLLIAIAAGFWAHLMLRLTVSLTSLTRPPLTHHRCMMHHPPEVFDPRGVVAREKEKRKKKREERNA